jgi:heavy metal sensor kinase
VPYYYKNKNLYSIQVGSSLKPITKILYGRMLFALLVIPLVLFFSAFLGGMIADRILRPVIEITSIAKSISYKDLSARVKLQNVDEELQYLVHAFNEMISRLDKSFRYIAEFSSNVAHELKTPLTIIRGESEVALMQERNLLEYQRVIRVNVEETEKLLKIVEDLLLISKLEYQPQAYNFEEFDFSSFMKEITEQAKKIAAQKNIAVKLIADNKPLLMKGDELHLRRLFLNLLNNAVKFTPQEGSITVGVHRNNRKLKVSISDTGVGIKPEHLNKIFNRFFHTGAASSGSEDGSGLGLSIALSIAKIHGGDISVKSAPQKGSTFTVTLPVID